MADLKEYPGGPAEQLKVWLADHRERRCISLSGRQIAWLWQIADDLTALRAAVEAAAKVSVVLGRDCGNGEFYVNRRIGKPFVGHANEHPADALVRWHTEQETK